MAKTIYETIKQWLKEQYDSDLLDFAREFDNYEEFTWAYKMNIDEYIWEEASSVCGDTEAIVGLVNWARKVSNVEWLDFEGRPYDEDEVLTDIKKYYIDELVGKVLDGIDYSGVPDIYDSIDTDELYELLQKCPEWVEQYGDEDDES